MKFILFLLIPGFIFTGCRDKELSPKHLSTISVVRETEENHNAKIKKQDEEKAGQAPVNQTQQIRQETIYHVIVASFGYSEKARAAKLVDNLREKGFPASILNSAQRLRISIESFNNEAEANSARDEYRKVTERQDIWVLKMD